MNRKNIVKKLSDNWKLLVLAMNGNFIEESD